jgi:diadenosine tetraphosphatase ApaH/serine/threonine PP2A family protein phosphatase
VLALLFDVHGNLAALDAVLADAERAGADRFLLGGDHVAFGPHPAETLERLRGLPGTTWIRGNTERWMADPSDAPAPMDAAARASHDAVGADAAAELAALPPSARIDDHTVAWHASFGSDMAGLAPEAQDGEVELLDPSARRIVVGHTHLQFVREAKDGTTICNPGSVGVPLDGDARAAYGLVRDSGTIELRRVPYDNAAAAAALCERFAGAWVDVVAGRIARARP